MKHYEIGPHVDSIKFSGGIVAGLSLLSTRIMRLSPDKTDDSYASKINSSNNDISKGSIESMKSSNNSNTTVKPNDTEYNSNNNNNKDVKINTDSILIYDLQSPEEYKHMQDSLLKHEGFTSRLYNVNNHHNTTIDATNNEKDHKNDNKNEHFIEIKLPKRSLYILSGPLRYRYAHEILGPLQSSKLYPDIPKLSERRLSVIFRDQLPEV